MRNVLPEIWIWLKSVFMYVDISKSEKVYRKENNRKKNVRVLINETKSYGNNSKGLKQAKNLQTIPKNRQVPANSYGNPCVFKAVLLHQSLQQTWLQRKRWPGCKRAMKSQEVVTRYCFKWSFSLLSSLFYLICSAVCLIRDGLYVHSHFPHEWTTHSLQ